MTAAASRRHLMGELSRVRNSSPADDRYATAHSDNSFNPDAEAIHSTMQFDNLNTATQQQLPTLQTRLQPASDDGTEDMSIEIGRGKGVGKEHRDVSSSFRFKLGDDQSSYEITGTPPLKAQGWKDTSRQGTSQQVNKSAPRLSGSQLHHRSLAETINSMHSADLVNRGNARHPRSSRFSSRNLSGNIPTRSSRFVREVLGGQTPPAQGTDDHALDSIGASQSFMIPELSNIQELLAGASIKATPGRDRNVKSRSRFAHASNTSGMAHADIQGVAIPKDENAIYQSLQILQARLAQFELEKSESERRATEQEHEIISLRNELDAERHARGLDSALGSDEERGAEEAQRREKAKLQSTVKSLQERLAKSDRKISNSEIAVKRITKERDDILAQFTITTEELKAENEVFRDERGQLINENDELKEELQHMRAENHQMRVMLAETTAQLSVGTQAGPKRRSSHAMPKRKTKETTEETSELDFRTEGRKDVSLETAELMRSKQAQNGLRLLQDFGADIQAAVTELNALKLAGRSDNLRNQPERTSKQTQRSHSRSQSRGTSRKHPINLDMADDVETTTEMSLTHKTRNTLQKMSIPNATATDKRSKDDARDLTQLSDIDSAVVETVRKRLEGERQSASRQRHDSAAVRRGNQDEGGTVIATEGPKRRSSLKNNTTSFKEFSSQAKLANSKDNDCVRLEKTVRVQSPHTSVESSRQQHGNPDTEDISILSNTSRRRRQRSMSKGEGETSAFIIPDITLHHSKSFPISSSQCIQHDPAKCTACRHDSTEVEIPAPTPVTDKIADALADGTDATIRPVRSAPLALAIVMKQLDDEVKHLKLLLAEENRQYTQHDPAFARHRRVNLKERHDSIMKEIEKRSDQLYNLHDVLLGNGNQIVKTAGIDDSLNDTLERIGVEKSGHIGRSFPDGLDGAGNMSDDGFGDLPWEGLSDVSSDDVMADNA